MGSRNRGGVEHFSSSNNLLDDRAVAATTFEECKRGKVIIEPSE
jgi:hypothetical protein